MIGERAKVESRSYEVQPWEFNVLLIEVLVLSGVAVGWLFSLSPAEGRIGPVPADALWKVLGFFVLWLALYPVLRIEARRSRGHELRFGRWVAGGLAGAVIGVLIQLAIR